MIRRSALISSICVLLIIAGCSGYQQSQTTLERETSTDTERTAEIATTDTETQTEQTATPKDIEDQNPSAEYNDSEAYTKQFRGLVRNDTVRLSELENPYESGHYDVVDLNVTDIRVQEIPPDDQRIVVVSQNLDNVSVQSLQNSLGKISIVFATVLKREAVSDEGDWNVSQVRVLSRHNGSLLFKNRIELNWANAWVFQLNDWDTEGYVRGGVGTSSVLYDLENSTFPSPYVEPLESNVEIESVENNITGVHVNQSGRQIFLTYTTTTPPTDTHFVDHMNEYRLILDEYGELAADEDFDSYNWTRLTIEEVYETPNGTYDTRRLYTVNSTFAERVHSEGLTDREIALYLFNNATFEDDAYYE